MKEIILHGGPYNKLRVEDRGQGQIVCCLNYPRYIGQAVYEIFPERRSEAFFLHNEWVKIPEPHSDT